MNERIKQLAVQAGFVPIRDEYLFTEMMEKFAKLIIDRCVRACVEDVADPRDTVELQCAQKIKRKFGVE